MTTEKPHNSSGSSSITLLHLPVPPRPLSSTCPPPPSEVSSTFSNVHCSGSGTDRNKVVVVTRALNFIASHVIRALLCHGYTIRGTIGGDTNEDDIITFFDIDHRTHKQLFLYEADILRKDGLTEVMKDAYYLVHVVTPLPTKDPKTEEDFILPAVEGTRSVLAQAINAKSIQRIVLISSIATVAWSAQRANNKVPYSEADWEEEENLQGYGKSQLLSEKLAWEIINSLPESGKIELVVLNPAHIFGPMLLGTFSSNMTIIKHLLEDKSLIVPNINIPIIDIRDVAQAVIKSMVSERAAGHRHILCSQNVWIKEIARTLASEFTRQGFKISQKEKEDGPSCIRYQRVHKDLDKYKSFEDGVFLFNNSRMRHVLEIEPHEMTETMVETAYSLIHWELIHKPHL